MWVGEWQVGGDERHASVGRGCSRKVPEFGALLPSKRATRLLQAAVFGHCKPSRLLQHVLTRVAPLD